MRWAWGASCGKSEYSIQVFTLVLTRSRGGIFPPQTESRLEPRHPGSVCRGTNAYSDFKLTRRRSEQERACIGAIRECAWIEGGRAPPCSRIVCKGPPRPGGVYFQSVAVLQYSTVSESGRATRTQTRTVPSFGGSTVDSHRSVSINFAPSKAVKYEGSTLGCVSALRSPPCLQYKHQGTSWHSIH